MDAMEAEPDTNGADGRIAKRQKISNGSHVRQSRPQHPLGISRVFAPYRTVGLVSPTSVPFVSVPLGKTTFHITTSVGRSLQTYDLRRGLALVFITRPQTPERITASAVWKDSIVAAWGGDGPATGRGVWISKRGKKVAELQLPRDLAENVKAFCIFGSWILGVCDSQLLVWKSSSNELYTTLRGISPVPFTACIVSLPTFLNKVIVGRQDGSAEIWNVSSGKLVYTILPPSTAYGAVTAIEPTPALSLVAIAFETGPLLIHDVRADQTIIQLSTPSGAPVTSISFRTDGLGAGEDGTKAGVMATVSRATGDVTFWDLTNGGRKAGVLRAAHAQPTESASGGTTKVEFLPGQAILVSTGLDNSLRTWIFDETPASPVPRILHERRGHEAAVTKLMFLPTATDGADDTGKWLLAGSKDRSLWGWSLRRDAQSTELSQGAIQKKAKKQGLLSGDRDFETLKCPPITSMACSLNRDGGIGAIPGKHPIWQQAGKGKQVAAEISAATGWESVLTAHENDSKARTWFWGRKKAGRWAFDTGDGGKVTAVAMSSCGTFGIVGSEHGGIDMFNMQSGMHRQRFPARLTPVQAKHLRLDVAKHGLIEENDGKKKFYRGQGKHVAAVVGLAVDSLNKTLVSASADGRVKFWNFANGILRDQIDWSYSTRISNMRFHRGIDLAACVCTDGSIRVVDITTHKLVRELLPSRTPILELQKLPISDFIFSDDGHWIAACLGQLILLWDLPTGHLIDAFKLEAECTSLAFSPTGEYLATATVDSVGVDIWTNRSLFTHVPSRHINGKELAAIVREGGTQAPTASGEVAKNLLPDVTIDEDVDEDEPELVDGIEGELDALSSDLLSLSLVPKSSWQNLLHLDLIRQRNKPTEPPKKPEKAPFFLPSLQDSKSTPKALTSLDEPSDSKYENSRLVRHAHHSPFTQFLHAASETDDFTPFIEHLKTQAPPAADLEIRSLSTADSGQGSEHVTFVRSLVYLLRARRDFELVQAWMSVYIRVHSDVVLHHEGVREAVGQWRAALEEERKRVRTLVGYNSGMLGYLRAARV